MKDCKSKTFLGVENQVARRGRCRRVTIDAGIENYLVISKRRQIKIMTTLSETLRAHFPDSIASLNIIPASLFKESMDTMEEDLLCKIVFDVDGKPGIEIVEKAVLDK